MNSELLFSPEFWERTPSEVQAALHALDARVAALEATVQQLREQRQQDSRTSSRSPSSDPPQALTKRPRREPTGRRPGGQPGHEGQARGVVPVEEGDVVLPVKPEHCRRCQRPLQGEDAQPQRHQMTEIPTVKPVVTEYQLHQLVCYHLSKRTTQNVLADLFGVALGLGSMANLEQATAQAMAEPVAEARA